MPAQRTFNMISGRFQPFHLGHLAYLEVVLNRPEDFIVGITNPDPTAIRRNEKSAHRHLAEANPYTFFERQLMIRRTLEALGVPSSRYSVVPFPINLPELWPSYLPERVVHYISVTSEWEEQKLELARRHGHEVVRLSIRAMSATDIRERMAKGEEWASMVPPAVASVIRELRAEPERA
jgi:nicotinamide mononucleotide adenylyltransferase